MKRQACKPTITNLNRGKAGNRRIQNRNPALKFSGHPLRLYPPKKDEIRFVPMHKIAARVFGGFDPEEN